MVYPREVLNKLRWKDDMSLEEATIWYVHRGAPGDLARISGSSIRSLNRLFFETAEATIPYHRIVRIEFQGRVLYDKDFERSKGGR